MGMYDHLNRIERAIEEKDKINRQLEKETQKQQLAKCNLLSLLETELKEAQAEGFDLYNANTKDRIINNIINNSAAVYLHNKAFTEYFLKNNYYKTIKQLNNLQKEAERPAKEYQKQIEKESKEELQKQKLQLQIEALKQKERDRQQKEQEKQQKLLILQEQQRQGGIIQALKITMYIVLAPLLIIGFFLIECAKEAGRGGRGRR